MRKFLMGCALTCVASAAAAQTSKQVDFSQTPGPATIMGEGVEVTLQPKMDEDDRIDVSASIRVPGYQSIITEEGFGSSAYMERWVGIGKLSTSDPAPSVLLDGFTGGAHCCATLKAIVPLNGKLKVVEFESIDGGPDHLFPKDLDGDGTVDFVRQDDSFRYTFASGASSFSPPRIFNIYKGQIIDVSDQSSFRQIWERFAKETRARCLDLKDEDRNGACVAYVAAGARLGRYEEFFKEADKAANPKPPFGFPEGCTIEPANGICPENKKLIFYTFSSALRWFLVDRGYIE